MADIVFNSAGLSIVDKWLEGAEDTSPATVSKSTIKNSKTQEVSSKDTKVGLGYRRSVVSKSSDLKSKTNGVQRRDGDALMQRILAQKQQTGKKRQVKDLEEQNLDSKRHSVDNQVVVDTEEEEDIGQLHGIVEDFAESRTATAGAKSNKDKNGKNAISKPAKKKVKVEDQLNRTDAVDNEEMKSHAVETGKPNDKSKKSNTTKSISLGIKPGKGGYWAQVFDASVDNGDNGADNKRRRPKTRSKQKNIRKDNRPADTRPSYRPLTEQTKKILEFNDP